MIGRGAAEGDARLTAWESLVLALWWLDYAMRNGESLASADENCGFRAAGRAAAGRLGLPLAGALFSLDLDTLESEYFDRFESVCDEVRSAGDGGREKTGTG